MVGTMSSYASRKVERFLTESRRCLHAFSKSVCWSFISKQCLCTIAISVRYTGKIDSGVTSNASGLVRVTTGAAVVAIVRWFTRSLLCHLSLSTVHCPLSTVHCPLSTVHCPLYTVDQISIEVKPNAKIINAILILSSLLK